MEFLKQNAKAVAAAVVTVAIAAGRVAWPDIADPQVRAALEVLITTAVVWAISNKPTSSPAASNTPAREVADA